MTLASDPDPAKEDPAAAIHFDANVHEPSSAHGLAAAKIDEFCYLNEDDEFQYAKKVWEPDSTCILSQKLTVTKQFVQTA